MSVVVRIHFGHYKENIYVFAFRGIKVELKRDLIFLKIKDFTYPLIIHISKENLCALKVRIHIGKL